MLNTDHRTEHQSLTSSMWASWISKLENGKSSHKVSEPNVNMIEGFDASHLRCLADKLKEQMPG